MSKSSLSFRSSSSASSSSRPSRLSLDLEAEIDRIDQEINKLQPQTPNSSTSQRSASYSSQESPLSTPSPYQSPQSSHSFTSHSSTTLLSPNSPAITLTIPSPSPSPSPSSSSSLSHYSLTQHLHLPTSVPSPTLHSTTISYLPLVNQLLATITHYATTLSSSFSSLPNEVTQCQTQLNQALLHYTNKRQKQIKHKQKESTQLIQQLKDIRNNIESQPELTDTSDNNNSTSASTSTSTTHVHSILTPLLSSVINLTSIPLSVFDPFHVNERKELLVKNNTLQSLLSEMNFNRESDMTKLRNEIEEKYRMEKNKLSNQLEEETSKFKRELENTELKYTRLQEQLSNALAIQEEYKRKEINYQDSIKELENKLEILIQTNKQYNNQIIILSDTLGKQNEQINQLKEEKSLLEISVQRSINKEQELKETAEHNKNQMNNSLIAIITKSTNQLKNIDEEIKSLGNRMNDERNNRETDALNMLKNVMNSIDTTSIKNNNISGHSSNKSDRVDEFHPLTDNNNNNNFTAGLDQFLDTPIISNYFRYMSTISSNITLTSQQLTNQLIQINNHYKSVINSIRIKNKERINQINNKHSVNIQQLTVNLQKQIEEIHDSHNNKMKQLENNHKLHMEVTLGILMEENEKKNKSLELKWKEYNSNNLLKLENELKDKNNEVLNWENKYKQLINNNKEMIENYLTKKKAEIEEIQQTNTSKLQEVTGKFLHKENQLNSSINELNKNINKLEEIRSYQDNELKSKDNIILQLNDSLTSLNNDLLKSKQSMSTLEHDCNNKCIEQLNSLKDQYEREERIRESKMENRMNSRKNEIINEYEEKIKELNKIVHDDIQELTSGFEEEKKQLIEELIIKDSRLAESSNEFTHIRQQINSEYQKQFIRLRKEHELSVNTALSDCRNRIKSLLQHYRQREELLCRDCKKRCKVIGNNFLLLCEEYCKNKGEEVELNTSSNKHLIDDEDEKHEEEETRRFNITASLHQSPPPTDNDASNNTSVNITAITTADLDSPTESHSTNKHIESNNKLLSYSTNRSHGPAVNYSKSRNNYSDSSNVNSKNMVSSNNSQLESTLKLSVKGISGKRVNKSKSTYADMLNEYLSSYTSSLELKDNNK